MVQQTTGYKIQMIVLFQRTRSLMLGKYTSIPIYSDVVLRLICSANIVIMADVKDRWDA